MRDTVRNKQGYHTGDQEYKCIQVDDGNKEVRYFLVQIYLRKKVWNIEIGMHITRIIPHRRIYTEIGKIADVFPLHSFHFQQAIEMEISNRVYLLAQYAFIINIFL